MAPLGAIAAGVTSSLLPGPASGRVGATIAGLGAAFLVGPWVLVVVRMAAKLLAMRLSAIPVLEVSVGAGRPWRWTRAGGVTFTVREEVLPRTRATTRSGGSLRSARIQHAAALGASVVVAAGLAAAVVAEAGPGSVLPAMLFAGNAWVAASGAREWWQLERAPPRPDALAVGSAVEEARILLRDDRVDDALEVLGAARRAWPEARAWGTMRIDAFGEGVRWAAALRLLGRGDRASALAVLARAAETPDVAALRAALLIDGGRGAEVPGSERLLDETLGATARMLLALALVGNELRDLHLRAGPRTTRAVIEAALAGARPEDPFHAPLLHERAWAATLSGDPGPALELPPEDTTVSRALRGEALVLAGRLEEGERALLALLPELTLAPHRAVVHGFLALAALRSGRHEVAASRWGEARAAAPDELGALVRMAPELRRLEG